MPEQWALLAESWDELLPVKSPILYQTSIIDLETDIRFSPVVNINAQGNDELTAEWGTNTEGEPTGGFRAVPAELHARYIRFRLSISGERPSMPPGHLIGKITPLRVTPQGGKTDYTWLIFDKKAPKNHPETHWVLE